MPVKHLGGHVRNVVGVTAMELRVEKWAQTMHIGVDGLWTVFKTIGVKKKLPRGAYRRLKPKPWGTRGPSGQTEEKGK